MPPQQPLPQMWHPSPAPRALSQNVLVWVVLSTILVLGAFLFVGIFVGGMGAFGSTFLGVLCIPFLFIIVVAILAFAMSTPRRKIPPPPPIQQPMVPAGQQGPVALDCPNCGGPPTNVDRFGIAICSYCGTRFLVR